VSDLAACLREIAACRVCRDKPFRGSPLPHEPRPVLRLAGAPPIVIAGQAPGLRVHQSGTPFTDPSGDRLRDWMGIAREQFYDQRLCAIVPMGFCFPGYDDAGADLPPRRECRETWHDRLFDALPPPRLLLAIGAPAQRYHLARLGLAAHLRPTVSATVAAWSDIVSANSKPTVFVLPHPSWRNNAWIGKHPWFASDLLPRLRSAVAGIAARRR
jgi:uracil-DNA glycosylase